MVLPKQVHLLQPVHKEFTGQDNTVQSGKYPAATVNVFSGSVSSLRNSSTTLNNT
jgi:hypothetical protein